MKLILYKEQEVNYIFVFILSKLLTFSISFYIILVRIQKIDISFPKPDTKLILELLNDNKIWYVISLPTVLG